MRRREEYAGSQRDRSRDAKDFSSRPRLASKDLLSQQVLDLAGGVPRFHRPHSCLKKAPIALLETRS